MAYFALSAVVLSIAGAWFLAYRMRRAGEDSMAAKVTQETSDVLIKQDRAAAKSAKTRDELIDRMRHGGF